MEQSNTHLWLIDRALLALTRYRGGQASWMAEWMVRYRAWIDRGNRDADSIQPYCNRGWYGPYYGRLFTSHFYDPDSMTNWRGEVEPTARSEGARCFREAGRLLRRGEYEGAFYHLGIALHYITDVTMPFHAANFTYFDSRPMGFHTAAERYAAQIKGRYHLDEVSEQSGPGTEEPGEWIHWTAARAKAAMPLLWNAAVEGYWRAGESHLWQEAITPGIGQQLQEAQRVAAGFLHLWFCTYAGRTARSAGERAWLFLVEGRGRQRSRTETDQVRLPGNALQDHD